MKGRDKGGVDVEVRYGAVSAWVDTRSRREG